MIGRPNVPAMFIARLFHWEVKERVRRRTVGRLVG